MIKKKSNAYEKIKKKIAKLALIQEATGYSPYCLMELFCKDITSNEYIDIATAYKYFNKQLMHYQKASTINSNHQIWLDYLKENYLTEDYFGASFEALAEHYRVNESFLKDFVIDAYKKTFPITPDMSPSEVARRNQKIGKISVKAWIGDIVRYNFFNEAPNFLMDHLKESLTNIDIFILRLLNDSNIEEGMKKLTLNQNLEIKLLPKAQQVKKKINKI